MAEIILSEQKYDGFALNEAFGCFAVSVRGLPFTLVAGQEYTVVWDSIKYVRKAVAFVSAEGFAGVYIGNALVEGKADSGEKFAIVCDTDNSYLHYMSLEFVESHTVAIYLGAVTTGAGITIKDRTGKEDVLYNGVTAIRVRRPDGTKKDFIAGEPVPTTIQPNFADGDIELFPNDGEVFSKVTVVTPPGLVPENIAKGVTVAGIKGDMVSGSTDTKPIRFYNAYGDVVYGFTRAEIRAMDALPPGPALGDLTFDKWTHTLDELKSEAYFADVGPMYKKNGTPAIVIIVRTMAANQTVYIDFQKTSSFKPTFYWGDGTSSQFSGTATQSTTSHAYSVVGEYIISIPIPSGSYTEFSLGHYSTYYFSGVDIYSGGVRDDYLSFSKPNNVTISALDCSTNSSSNFVYCLQGCTRLKFISLYNGRGFGGRTFQNCFSLKVIAGKTLNQLPSLLNAFNFERMDVKTYSSAFTGCDSIEEIKLVTNGGTVKGDINSRWALLMTSETPPTVNTARTFGTFPIYVPDTAVDAYKAADGWSNVASYIFPASEYPDK